MLSMRQGPRTSFWMVFPLLFKGPKQTQKEMINFWILAANFDFNADEYYFLWLNINCI